MRSAEEYATVLALVAQGLNDCAIARRTGIPRSTVREWRTERRAYRRRLRVAGCGACGALIPPLVLEQWPAYAYLLGLYLGDGHLARNRKGVWHLRIACFAGHPQLHVACAEAIGRVLPGRRASTVRHRTERVVYVSSYTKHWACLLPQHGPGLKHQRPIVLEPWQQEIADAFPDQLVRGLIHSDGWRGTNRVVVRGKAYEGVTCARGARRRSVAPNRPGGPR